MSLPPLSALDFQRFRDFIHERCFIFFPESRAYLLESKLKQRMKEIGCNDYGLYWARLERDHSGEEFECLLTEITTNETSFYRNQPQMEVFASKVLPELLKQSGEVLNIWSAACSSGEEPLTLALLLHEARWMLRGTKVRIFANDLNRRMIAHAKQGIFNRHTLRNVPESVLARYFKERDAEHYIISSELLDYVTFRVLNFADERGMLTVPRMDMIMCRNTLIYFSERGKKQTIDHFRRVLRPGGFLLLGHAETLWNNQSGFEYVAYPMAFAYRRLSDREPSS